MLKEAGKPSCLLPYYSSRSLIYLRTKLLNSVLNNTIVHAENKTVCVFCVACWQHCNNCISGWAMGTAIIQTLILFATRM